ncbi:MAG TPA: COX15/CtaA family protein [Terriglobia bacterium]|nr:COX15/CtaA family protein [Terriglobia bacterium]
MNTTPPKRSRWLHRYAVFVACMTFLLLIAGALVTSNDAGLSVPDWPTSFGSFRIPRMVGGVKFEDGHRMIAGFVAILTVILALALWAKEDRRWLRWLGGFAVLAVIIQAVLGGLGVIFYLPLTLTVSHSCMAEIFFATMVSLAIFTSPKWRWEEAKASDPSTPSLRHAAVAVNVIILVQILLGAAYRNEVQDLFAGEHLRHGVGVLPHIVFAGVVLAAVLYLLVRTLRLKTRNLRLLYPVFALVTLVVIQIFLGVGAYTMMLLARAAPQPVTPVVLATVMHVAVGALVFVTSIVVTYQTYRFVAPPATRLSLPSEETVTAGNPLP